MLLNLGSLSRAGSKWAFQPRTLLSKAQGPGLFIICRYDAAAAYGHDAAASATSQWAAPASSLWSSSSMAAAAAAASATPSAQQQYGFQHPLAMAAK